MSVRYLLCSEGLPLAIYDDATTAAHAVHELPHFADEFVCLVALPFNPGLTIRQGQVAAVVEEDGAGGAASVASRTPAPVTLSPNAIILEEQRNGGAE